MKNPNGYGTIRHYKDGNRREPYVVFITTGWEITPEGKKKQIQKRHSSHKTLKQAKIALADYNKAPYDMTYNGVTFKDIYELHVVPQLEKISYSAQRNRIAAFNRCESLHNKKIKNIKRSHLQQILDDHRHLSKGSLDQTITLFKMIFDFCVAEDILVKSPADYLLAESDYVSKEKKSIKREEIRLLWDNLDFVLPNKNKPNNASIYSKEPFVDTILILIYTGLRISEFLDLKVEDVHLEERWIDLRGTKTPSARRIIPIHKDIVPLIEKRMGETYLFEIRNKKVEYTGYRDRYFKPLCRHFGIDYTPHEARHTFSTFSAISDLNEVYRKKMMGHKIGDITNDVYTHIFVEDLVKEIDKFTI